MKEKFSNLLKLLSLVQIRIIDSHERVLSDETPLKQEEDISIETIQSINDKFPLFDGTFIKFNLKYDFNFSRKKNGKSVVYFSAAYVVVVTFKASDVDQAKELLSNEDLMNIFITQQLKKTLWPMFRTVLMDAMSRHSLQVVLLPWIK